MTHKILIFLLVGLIPCILNASARSQPNVVIILTDDQGWGDLSVHGNRNLDTPNIDRLALQGMELRNFYVCPICSPTRAEFLTGRYNPRTGVRSASRGEERLDLDETTLAEIFRDAGYKTAAFGKWHNGMQPPYHPNARGFEEFYGFCSGHWGNYYSPMLEHNGKIIRGNGFVIDDFTKRAMDYIENHKDERFFVYIPYNTPHSPMQVPDPWWNKFANKKLRQLARPDQEEKTGHTLAALAMCENIDWNVGRLLKKLDELELCNDTIVIYFSDNGPNGYRWNADMKGRKGRVDEGGVRSPFFIRWPGKISPGQQVTEITGSIDLLPTLTDICGIEDYKTLPLDGVSLKPLLLQSPQDWNDRLYVNHFKGKTSIRNKRFRLDQAGKLYDMINDPGQRVDVSERFPEVAKTMRSKQEEFNRTVVTELKGKTDERPFTIGHPDFNFTQLPARDGIANGNIKRSGRAPNCSFYTNWVREEDSITWNAEVLRTGDFQVDIYYTCPEKDLGSTIRLSFGDSFIETRVRVAHDPAIEGEKFDRFPRVGESYVKAFKPMDLGVIHLKKGKNLLRLSAPNIAGSLAMEVRLLMFHRIN